MFVSESHTIAQTGQEEGLKLIAILLHQLPKYDNGRHWPLYPAVPQHLLRGCGISLCGWAGFSDKDP